MKPITTLLFSLILLFSNSLFAQENPTENSQVSVKIETPNTPTVARSFTLSGHAQAGAKLQVRINGKTFGRYRADISGKFTIGIHVPHDSLDITVEHLIKEKVVSSDTIHLEINNDTQLEIPENKNLEPKTKPDDESVNSKTTDVKTAEKTTGSKTPKESKSDFLDSKEKELPTISPIPKSPVILNKKSNAGDLKIHKNYDNTNAPAPFSRAGRILIESVSTIAYIGVTTFAFVLAVNNRNMSIGEGILSVLGFGVFQIATIPLVVYGSGTLSGGKGSLWAPYAGEVLGIAASFLVITGAGRIGGNADIGASFAAILFPIAGAIIAYEMSHTKNVQNAKDRSRTQAKWQLMPSFGYQDEKVHFGLSTRF